MLDVNLVLAVMATVIIVLIIILFEVTGNFRYELKGFKKSIKLKEEECELFREISAKQIQELKDENTKLEIELNQTVKHNIKDLQDDIMSLVTMVDYESLSETEQENYHVIITRGDF